MSTPEHRNLVVLGSTGSIGTQALDIVARNSDRFAVVALASGGSRLELLASQVLDTGAHTVGIADPESGNDFANALDREAERRGLEGSSLDINVLIGPDAATQVAGIQADIVLNGMTGSVGLGPTLAALKSGALLALANKESLVVGGALVTSAARPGQIVPVDSEHSALAQCLRGGTSGEVARLILTASGGPFRGSSIDDLAAVTPQQALAHPTWDMGPVVTINSATLVNKGLEVIEAHLLFGIPFDRIDVVVHPQSIVHSMVEFTDGSTLAQASPPDMRAPISLALGWPDRVPNAAPACDWTGASQWEFMALDNEVFPAVHLARQVGAGGGTAPAVFNAANEEAVAAFLAGRLSFPGIIGTVKSVVDAHLSGLGSNHVTSETMTLQDVLDAEVWARDAAREICS